MDDNQIAVLRTQVEREIRARNEQMRVTTTVSERLSQSRSEDFAAAVAKQREERTQQEIDRTLAFAIQISERDNIAGELSQEKFEEAELLAAHEHMRNVTRQFEERLNNTPHLPERRRMFAQDVLAIHKKHEQELTEVGLNPEKRSEESLQQVAQKIAADFHEVARKYANHKPDEKAE